MARLAVYNVALDQQSMAMPLVDLDGDAPAAARIRLGRATRGSRAGCPTRSSSTSSSGGPAAIWQHNQQLALIDMDGVVLEPVRLDAMPDLPLVIGPAANHHAAELARLLEAAPQLKPIMAGATWVGGRRWDMRFQSGEVLALPEGEAAAQKALAHFARMDQAAQLLGRGYRPLRHARSQASSSIRVSREPGSTVPELAPGAAAAAPRRPAPTPSIRARTI